MRIEGFLVVEKEPSDAAQTVNPKYRGVDRLPPWSREEYDRGFNDPYIFSPERAPTGLVPTLPATRKFKEKFSEVYSPEKLEIIFAQIEEGPIPASAQFLGFDVAGERPPFYSYVGDPPVSPDVRQLLAGLNENGLFSDVQSANEYLKRLRQYLDPDSPVPSIWRIYYVE